MKKNYQGLLPNLFTIQLIEIMHAKRKKCFFENDKAKKTSSYHENMLKPVSNEILDCIDLKNMFARHPIQKLLYED